MHARRCWRTLGTGRLCRSYEGLEADHRLSSLEKGGEEEGGDETDVPALAPAPKAEMGKKGGAWVRLQERRKVVRSMPWPGDT